MSRLAGQRYWVIGASQGIGRALAFRLARVGVALVVSARNEAALRNLTAQLPPVKTPAGGHLALPLDVTVQNGPQDAFAAVGEIDGIIYCAGAYEPMSARQPEIDAVETMITVNVTGAFRTLAAVVPAFCARRTGHIVLVGSLAGYRGLPNAWGYGASKAAVIHLAENLRCDLAGTGVRVQVCNPGFVATRLTEKNRFSMPFLMTPDDAARRIVAGMDGRRFEIAFPWILKTAFAVLASMPRGIHFALFTGSGRHRRPRGQT